MQASPLLIGLIQRQIMTNRQGNAQHHISLHLYNQTWLTKSDRKYQLITLKCNITFINDNHIEILTLALSFYTVSCFFSICFTHSKCSQLAPKLHRERKTLRDMEKERNSASLTKMNE